jgi:hypothetical protein
MARRPLTPALERYSFKKKAKNVTAAVWCVPVFGTVGFSINYKRI